MLFHENARFRNNGIKNALFAQIQMHLLPYWIKDSSSLMINAIGNFYIVYIKFPKTLCKSLNAIVKGIFKTQL
jgi:hypothetical protein